MVVVLLTKLCQVNALAIFSRIVVAPLPLGLGPAEYLLLLSHSFVGARENLKKKIEKCRPANNASCGWSFWRIRLAALTFCCVQSSILSRFVSSSQRTAPEVKNKRKRSLTEEEIVSAVVDDLMATGGHAALYFLENVFLFLTATPCVMGRQWKNLFKFILLFILFIIYFYYLFYYLFIYYYLFIIIIYLLFILFIYYLFYYLLFWKFRWNAQMKASVVICIFHWFERRQCGIVASPATFEIWNSENGAVFVFLSAGRVSVSHDGPFTCCWRWRHGRCLCFGFKMR